MDPARELAAADTKATFPAAWLFGLLNVVFRDIHDLFGPGLLRQMMSGVVDGVQVIAMVLLSRLLAYRLNRWANIIAAVVTPPLLLTNGPKDLDDVWFLAIDGIALLLLAWFAWRWRGVDPSPTRAAA